MSDLDLFPGIRGSLRVHPCWRLAWHPATASFRPVEYRVVDGQVEPSGQSREKGRGCT